MEMCNRSLRLSNNVRVSGHCGPLVALGAIGPTILLAIVALVAWLCSRDLLEQSRSALTARALESLRYASRNVAVVAGNALELRFETVERIAADPELSTMLSEFNSEEELNTIGGKLSDPTPRNAIAALPRAIKEKSAARKTAKAFANVGG